MTIPHDYDPETNGLARFITPIGPVGGYADLKSTDTFLGNEGKGE